jgi:hypothetical protein
MVPAKTPSDVNSLSPALSRVRGGKSVTGGIRVDGFRLGQHLKLQGTISGMPPPARGALIVKSRQGQHFVSRFHSDE